MTTVEETKSMFFKQLIDLATYKYVPGKSAMYMVSYYFYRDLFNFCRYCHLKKYCLSEDDKTQLSNYLKPAVANAKSSFIDLRVSFENHELYSILRTRSGLQFLQDDFSQFLDEKSKADVEEMIGDTDLAELIEELSYPEAIGTYPDEPVPDLAGVPESHTWWTKNHREGKDNEAAFKRNLET